MIGIWERFIWLLMITCWWFAVICGHLLVVCGPKTWWFAVICGRLWSKNLVVCGHLPVVCGPKTQNCQFKLKFEYAEFNGDVHFFYFKPEISILDKSGVIKQICLLKLKFYTYIQIFLSSQVKPSLTISTWFTPVASRIGKHCQISISKLYGIVD